MSLHKFHIPGDDEQKYHAKRMEIDGHLFASKAEGNRYLELKLLQSVGEIKDLELQVPFKLEVNGILIARYVADFVYHDCATGKAVVEDCKGFRTREYRIKKKLMFALHHIVIFESGGR